MSKKILTDLDFANVSRLRNIPNPVLAQDAATKAYVDAGSTPTPFVILAMGQSNIVQEPAYAWSPEPNLKTWDWDGTYDDVGSAFVAPDGTKANVVWSFANEIAKRYPHLEVYVIKIAVGGMPIEQFIHGYSYKFDDDTTASDPASGYLKLNAAPASATQIVVSQFDKNGIDKGGVFTQTAIGGKVYLVDQTSGATATYTITSAAVFDDPNDKCTTGLSYVSGSGTFSLDDEILALSDPDIWAIMQANITPALSAAGVTKIDQFYWWQGESNARDPRRLVEDLTTFHDQLLAESWFDRQTPMLISGIASNAVTGVTSYGLVNWYLQKFVALDPNSRKFTYPAGTFPQSFWDSGASYIHMLASGYMGAGKLAFANWSGNAERPALSYAVYDTDYGSWTFNGTRTSGLSQYSYNFYTAPLIGDPPRGIIARFFNDDATAANGAMIGFGVRTGGTWALGQNPGATSFGIYQNRTVTADGTLAYYISNTGRHGINTNAPTARLSVDDSNPTRGVVATIGNPNSVGSTGAMLQLSAAGVGGHCIGLDAGATGGLATYFGRTTASDGTKITLAASASLQPGSDNAISLGVVGARWSVVYAVTGTINTSDVRLKTDIAPSALGLDFINALRPVSYRWIEGGIEHVEVEDVEEFEEIETEEIVEKYTDYVVENGVAVEVKGERKVTREIVDYIPVVDSDGNVVYDIEPATKEIRDKNGDLISEALPERSEPRIVAVPRMVKRTRKVKRTEAIKKPGRRTHYGLIAQEVAEALKAADVGDFAGYVLANPDDPESEQGLRYAQFIAPLIKAVQELSAKVAALEGKANV